MKEKISGIYKITNTINNKFYIGSSNNIKKRWNRHKMDLRNNKHKNTLLQNSYNKYGVDVFLFEIIEIISEYNMLLEREQYYLDKYKSYNKNIGFNINTKSSGGNNISNNPKKDDIISRISKSMKNVWVNKTDEEKMKQTSFFVNNNPSKKGIYLGNQNKYIIIDNTEYISLTDAENKLNIKKGTIHYRIKSKSFPNYSYKE